MTPEQKLKKIEDILNDRDIDKIAPILKDAPKSLADIRQLVNDMIRDTSTGTRFGQLLEILEQIVMKLTELEARPSITIAPMTPGIGTIPPYVAPFAPQWPPYTPYVGDPPFPGSSTICSTSDATGPLPQADGHADVAETRKFSRYDRCMGTGVKNEDLPF